MADEVLQMKKIVTILLSGIYALSVFVIAPAAFYCCEDAAGASIQNATNAPAKSDDGCNNPENGSVKNIYHSSAATVHFSLRHHSLQPHTAFLTAVNTLPGLATASTPYKKTGKGYSSQVPLYRLHCVYRI